MGICPHCEAEISYVRFAQDVTEFGTCTLSGRQDLDYECDDSESGEIIYYKCPECDEELSYRQAVDALSANLDETEQPEPEPLLLHATNVEAIATIDALRIHCPYCDDVHTYANNLIALYNHNVECVGCGERFLC